MFVSSLYTVYIYFVYNHGYSVFSIVSNNAKVCSEKCIRSLMYIRNWYSDKSVHLFYLAISFQDLAHSKCHIDVEKALRM